MAGSSGTEEMNMVIDRLPEIDGKVLRSEPMSSHTSFKIGGPADLLVVPADVAELQLLLRWARKRSVPVFIIGAGTNLLVSDKGIRGVVLQFGAGFMGASVHGTKLTAGCGVRLPSLVRRALGAKLSGLEGLAGIPGTVGGAICMNAGTSAGCIKDTLESVRVADLQGNVSVVDAKDLGLSYRRSSIAEMGLIVIEATFALEKEDSTGIDEIVDNLLQRRKASQPMGIHTAGSVFKNPEQDFAGRILEHVGAKGMQIGGARVSGKHANFIENTGNATAADVKQLVERLQALSAEKCGVELEPEIQMVGEW